MLNQSDLPPKAKRPHPHKSTQPVRPHPHKGIQVVRPHPKRLPWPVTITIKTLPVVPNVVLSFDGNLLTTSANGTATFTEEHNLAAHSLSIINGPADTAQLRYRFNRWFGQRNPNEVNLPQVTGLPMRSNYTITAAYNVQYPVIPRLVTQYGAPVSLASTTAVVVKGASAQLTTVPNSGPAWLDGISPVFKNNTPATSVVTYSLQSVIVKGTNVVDAGRQTFQPARQSEPTFTTLFYNLSLTAHDALFGATLGDRAVVRFPDGSTRTVLFNQRHQASLLALPRGKYSVTYSASHAIIADVSVSLSKNESLDAAAITRVDLIVLGSGLSVVGVALLVVGRRRWLHRVAVRVRPHRHGWRRVKPRFEGPHTDLGGLLR